MASELGQDDPGKSASKSISSLKSLVEDLDLSGSEQSTRDALSKIKQQYSKKLEHVELLVTTGGLGRLLNLLACTKAMYVADSTLSIVANCLIFAAARREVKPATFEVFWRAVSEIGSCTFLQFYRLEGVAKVGMLT